MPDDATNNVRGAQRSKWENRAQVVYEVAAASCLMLVGFYVMPTPVALSIIGMITVATGMFFLLGAMGAFD